MANKRKLLTRTVELLTLVAVFILLCLLKNSQSVSEWIATNISRKWIAIFGRVFSIFPFSVYELFLYIIGVSIIIIFAKIIRDLIKKNFLSVLCVLMTVGIIAFTVINVYTLSAGFSYNRQKVSLPGTNYELTDSEVEQLAPLFVQQYNELAQKLKRDEQGNVICPYSFNQLAKILQKEYKRIDGKYLSSYTPRAKKILSSRIMSEMHITGVFFAPYGEVNINGMLPTIDLPVTMAHEMAHAKGVMREDEANLIAYYLTCSSKDDYLRYCGYSAIYYRVFSAIHFDSELRQNLYSSLNPKIFTELQNSAKFWDKYDILSQIADFFNDLYLKLQGVKEGTDSYIDKDIVVDVPVDDGNGNITIETKYYYSDLQKMIFSIVKDD